MAALLREYRDTGAILAWSPHSTSLVLGSREGGGGGFDDYGGELQLHVAPTTPLTHAGAQRQQMAVATVKTTLRFTSLAWGGKAKDSDPAHQLQGLIAGGMTDGTVRLWDPALIVASTKEGVAPSGQQQQHPDKAVAVISKHKSACRALQFNPLKQNLLASGGSDRQVLIFDLNSIASPHIYGPSPNTADMHNGEVTAVAWNTQVPHILASGSVDGCTVWDLRESKPWCRVRGGSFSGLVWNPTEGLHLMTSSEDSPTLKLFDLRGSTTTPLAEFQGHTGGIYSISWCLQDTGLLMSCGKDGKLLMWDLFSGQPVWEAVGDITSASAVGYNEPSYSSAPISSTASSFFVSQQPNAAAVLGGDNRARVGGAAYAHHPQIGGSNTSLGTRKYQVAWCPTQPGVIGTCSFDRKTQIISVVGAGSSVSTVDGVPSSTSIIDPAAAFSRPPTWLSRRCGATFGFGGKLVRFNASTEPIGDEAPGVSTIVTLNTVVTDLSLVDRARNFDEKLDSAVSMDMAAQDPNLPPSNDHLKSLCHERSNLETNQTEKDTWRFMTILFETDARPQLLNHLGYSIPPPLPPKEKPQEIQQPAAPTPITQQHRMASKTSSSSQSPLIQLMHRGKNNKSADDFFSSPGKTDEGDSTTKTEQAAELKPAPAASAPAPIIPAIAANQDEEPLDEKVRLAIICGNFELAVSRSIENGDYAAALLLATCGGSELWASTQRAYLDMQRRKRPFVGVVMNAILNSELPELIETSDLTNGKWKELLAILSTYSKPEDFPALCDSLGRRLETELGAGKETSEATTAAIVCYMLSMNVEKTVDIWIRTSSSLGDVVEKASVFLRALSDPNRLFALPEMSHKFAAYAESLAEQGELIVASKYAEMSGDGFLLDRIQKVAEKGEETNWDYQAQAPAQTQEYVAASNNGYYQEHHHHQEQQIHSNAPAVQQQPQYNTFPNAAPYATPAATMYGSTPMTPAPIQDNTNWSYAQQQQQQVPLTNTPRPTIQENDGFHTTAGNAIAGAKYGNLTPGGYPQQQQQQQQQFGTQGSMLSEQAPEASAPPPVQQVPHDMIPYLQIIKAMIENVKMKPLAAPEKRQIEEADRAEQALESLLASGVVTPDVQEQIRQMAMAFQAGDFLLAQQINVQLTTTSWEANKSWLKGLKYATMLALKKP